MPVVPDRSSDSITSGRSPDPEAEPAVTPDPDTTSPPGVSKAREVARRIWEAAMRKCGWRGVPPEARTPDPDADRWNDDGGP